MVTRDDPLVDTSYFVQILVMDDGMMNEERKEVQCAHVFIAL